MSKEKKMFEIVEFYPEFPFYETENGVKKLGTLHIHLCSMSLDLRGMPCLMTAKGHVLVYLPNKSIVDTDGTRIRYPVISFLDLKFSKSLKEFVKKEAVPYVKQRVEEILKEKS